jgi:hypothetical protein
MDLFIRIENGSPVDHPITLENLQLVYPDFDPVNPPENFMPFVKLGVPSCGHFEKYEGVTYVMESNYVTEIHHVRPMNEEEKNDYINAIKIKFLENGGDEDWLFDENTISFVPPIPYPTDGQKYLWEKDSNTWILDTTPEPPKPDLAEEANTIISKIISIEQEVDPRLYQLVSEFSEKRNDDFIIIEPILVQTLRQYQLYFQTEEQKQLENQT